MRQTFHLVPAEAWAAAQADPGARRPYTHPSLASEGFIHCTDGEAALDVPWRYDVAGSPYPHIYGSIRQGAVLAVSPVGRGKDGGFGGLITAPRV